MTPQRTFPAPPASALAVHGPDGISHIHLNLGHLSGSYLPSTGLAGLSPRPGGGHPWSCCANLHGMEETAGRRHLEKRTPWSGAGAGGVGDGKMRRRWEQREAAGCRQVDADLLRLWGQRGTGGHLEAVGLVGAESGAGLHG